MPRGERLVRVALGPLRGTWLPLDLSTIERHLWLNTYEPWFQTTLSEHLRPKMTVWDVGAFIGYYIALVNRLAAGGLAVAVEPNPSNLRRLRQTITVNNLQNVIVVPEAVGSEIARAQFRTDGPMGALSEGGTSVVSVTTLDALLDQHPAPEILIMDIEGGELAAIDGGLRLFTDIRPLVLIELHGKAGVQTVLKLQDLGYHFRTQKPLTVEEQMLRTHRVHALAIPE
jgi:FkbM family methyltransferase